MQNNRHFVIDDWQLGFEHPAGWRVESEEKNGATVFRLNPEAAPAVEVTVERLNFPGVSVEAVLQQRVASVGIHAEQFKLLKQLVESRGEKRAAAVYQYLHNGAAVVSQQVIVPLVNGAYIAVIGVTPIAEWKTYAKLFSAVAMSVTALEIASPEDVEIVAGEARSRAITTLAAECAEKWAACPQQGELVAILRDEELAKIIWAACGSMFRSWLTNPLPALANRSPMQSLLRAEWKHELAELLLRLNPQFDNIRELGSH